MTPPEDPPKGRRGPPPPRGHPGARRGEGPKGREAIENIEARLGGLVGGLSEALGRAADRLRETADEAERAGGGARGGPLEAHVSVRVGGLAAGAAHGSAPEDRAAPAGEARSEPEPPRRPDLETWETETGWRLAAELPGVALDGVEIAIAEGRLALTAEGARRYAAETAVPGWLEEGLIERGLVNGILELRAERPVDGGGA